MDFLTETNEKVASILLNEGDESKKLVWKAKDYLYSIEKSKNIDVPTTSVQVDDQDDKIYVSQSFNVTHDKEGKALRKELDKIEKKVDKMRHLDFRASGHGSGNWFIEFVVWKSVDK